MPWAGRGGRRAGTQVAAQGTAYCKCRRTGSSALRPDLCGPRPGRAPGPRSGRSLRAARRPSPCPTWARSERGAPAAPAAQICPARCPPTRPARRYLKRPGCAANRKLERARGSAAALSLGRKPRAPRRLASAGPRRSPGSAANHAPRTWSPLPPPGSETAPHSVRICPGLFPDQSFPKESEVAWMVARSLDSTLDDSVI
ncbi:uncharacterized protein ACIGJ3_012051 [Trichechus inunguis]